MTGAVGSNRSPRRRASERRRREQRGSGILEGGLVTLGFLAILLGMFDFGRAAFAYTQVQWLAGDGARYASVRGSTVTTPATATSISSYVTGNMVGLITSSATVNTAWSPNNSPGGLVTVKVQYTFSPLLVPYLNSSMSVLGADTTTVLQ